MGILANGTEHEQPSLCHHEMCRKLYHNFHLCIDRLVSRLRASLHADARKRSSTKFGGKSLNTIVLLLIRLVLDDHTKFQVPMFQNVLSES
jgi:hypothetical protein